MNLTEEEKELVLKHRQEKRNFKPRELSSYTADEKVKHFDAIYTIAISEYKTCLLNNFVGHKDIENWCYEVVMETLGKGIWDFINSFD